MEIIDITPTLSASSPVFPGDTVMAIAAGGCPVNVARLTLSPHTGAHADAPLHYHRDGAPIDNVELGTYIGPCHVVHLINAGPVISTDDIAGAFKSIPLPYHPRLLIRTYERQPDKWDPDFTAVSAGAIDWIARQGFNLIGVDTASLDPATSKTMDAHEAVFKNDMRILEGLKLDDVASGEYELIALPLKLGGLDAAPVRAVLRPLP